MGYTRGRKWSEEDDQFIRDNFGEMSYKEMAEHFGVSYTSVQARANKHLGLKNYEYKKWTDEEIHFLKDNYPDKLGHYCSEKLGRSFHATHKMVKKLNLKPNWKHKYVSREGYIVLCHDRDNKIAEHRFVMEQKLGRKLKPTEIVHHIDGDKFNNDINNLFITNRSEHATIHGKERGGINHKR